MLNWLTTKENIEILNIENYENNYNFSVENLPK